MAEPTARYMEIFFDLFEGLPQQGPGSRACTAQALDLCRDLPPSPAILDLGCGVGAQTLHLAELTAGSIVAMDNHAPSIERLRAAVAERGLEQRIRPMVADIALPTHPAESFDLIWSEGALYNIGIGEALRVYESILRQGGYLAFTEAVWRKEGPPAQVKALFADYPAMGWASDVLRATAERGLSLVGHFTLPDEAWWDDFYTPMERRIEALRLDHEGDAEALAVLEELATEPELHRRHGDYYAYEFFVLRRG